MRQNPWTKFDPEGLKVKVEETEKKDPKTGKVISVHTRITITGKVIDQSSAKRTKQEQEKIVKRITKEIEGDYTGQKGNHTWDADVRLDLVKSSKDIKKDDHVFKIVDSPTGGGIGYTNKIGGKEIEIDNALVAKNPKNTTDNSSLERTSAHEGGILSDCAIPILMTQTTLWARR